MIYEVTPITTARVTRRVVAEQAVPAYAEATLPAGAKPRPETALEQMFAYYDAA